MRGLLEEPAGHTLVGMSIAQFLVLQYQFGLTGLGIGKHTTTYTACSMYTILRKISSCYVEAPELQHISPRTPRGFLFFACYHECLHEPRKT
jgi:hypothetical protein